MSSHASASSLVLLAFLSLSACRCGEPPCTAQSDCPEGSVCLEGFCVEETFDGGAGDGGASDSGYGSTTDGGETDGGSCGDGRLSGAEDCDDGNVANGDGCSDTCVIDPNYSCPVPGAPCVLGPVCGDGRLAGLETCDDHNLASDDGCSATCTIESGWACPTVGVACAAASCGDGKLAGFEECDDGNAAAGDGCGATCVTEEGFACPTPATACYSTVCGDKRIEGTEQCDDGDHDLGDGCDTRCRAEPRCTNGVCIPVCGDSIRLPQEACDDGNTRSGDGCSATCTVELGFICSDAPPAAQATLAIPIVYRDFLPFGMDGGHIDFDNAVGSEKGIVTDRLDPEDDKPVYGAHVSTSTTHGAVFFDQWYRDVLGVNRTEVDTLVVTRTQPDTYVFDNNAFFPMDGRGWQRDGIEPYRGSADNMHNFSFTSELRYWFTYSGGEMLTFRGDDDVWVYINGHLAVDLGGVHSAETGSITLDATAASDAGLVDGGIYEVAVFQAERHVVASSYQLTLKGFNATKSSCAWRCGDGIVTRYEVCDDGANDGGYGGCMPGCLAHGPYCGDSTVDDEFGELCDEGVNIGTYGHCSPGCKSIAKCGDSVIQSDVGEECDDGNTVSRDGCSDLCRSEIQ